MKVSIYERISGSKKYLYLQIADGGKRIRHSLSLYLFKAPKDADQRNHNSATIAQAKSIQAKKQLELQHHKHGEEYVAPDKISFYELFSQEVAEYRKKDVMKLKGCLSHYEAYQGTKPFMLTQHWLDGFKEYLTGPKSGLHGETPSTYISRFKRICKLAYRRRIVSIDPGVLDFSIKFDRHHLRKEVLTESELAILEKTECGNEDVYRAFMFSALSTGLRMGDVAKLTWHDLRGWKINIQQGKTGRFVSLPVNKMGQRFAGTPSKPNSLVFPKMDCTANNVNKVLKFWVNKAGLQKHVTFHSARHTFCTLLMKRKVDYKTIISAMGWDEKSGMEHILRYAHLVDENVKDAVSQLDSIAL